MIAALFASKQKRINWDRIYHTKIKGPYGTFALDEYTKDLFPNVTRSRHSFRQLLDTLSSPTSFFSLSKSFEPTESEIQLLLESVEAGSHFLIAANDISKKLIDTLGIQSNYIWQNAVVQEYEKEFVYSVTKFFALDTVHLSARHPGIPKGEFVLRRNEISSNLNLDEVGIPLIKTGEGVQTSVRIEKGEGSITLVTTPVLFSNIYLLYGDNEVLVRYLFSQLPGENLVWTEFYELGSGLSTSPFRFILSEEALKYALYTLLLTLLVFVVFEVKRRQRAIPIVEPPVNMTLQFVSTIGNLYFENGNAHSIALKRIYFFFDFVRTRFLLDTDKLETSFIEKLTKKSGLSLSKVEKLVSLIIEIKNAKNITQNTLLQLSQQLDDFYNELQHHGK